jgi:hypothetical protein
LSLDSGLGYSGVLYSTFSTIAEKNRTKNKTVGKVTAANSAHITAAGDLQLENLFHYLRLARTTRRGSEIRSRNMRGSL